MLKKIVLINLIIVTTLLNANDNNKYQEPTTGVSVELSDDNTNWKRIRATGAANLLFGDSMDIRLATRKATMRAKAHIAKFLSEKIHSQETINEMSKIISSNKNNQQSAQRNTVSEAISSLSNSADQILKGILVIEQQINRKDKYVQVTVGMSRKTINTANSLKNTIKQDSYNNNYNNNNENNSNNGRNEIRRSSNYNNF